MKIIEQGGVLILPASAWDDPFWQSATVGKQPVMEFVEQDEDEIRRTAFELHFESGGSGFGFPCDSNGQVDASKFNEVRFANWRRALDGEWQKIEVRAWTKTTRLCGCGSGMPSHAEYDAQGIYLCRTCPKCRAEKLGRYRPEILTGYNQLDVSEPIDPEC